MEQIKRITVLCTQAKTLFNETTSIRNDIDVLQEALELLGGKNEAITEKIQECQRKEEASQFRVAISEIKQAVKDAYPSFFSESGERFSIEAFSVDTDDFYRNPIRKIVFKEGEDSDFVQKGLEILLDLSDDLMTDYLLCLSKKINHDDGRGGGKHSLLCKLMKDGTIEYSSGYYRTGDDPPFQSGYVYKPISKEQFWEQY